MLFQFHQLISIHSANMLSAFCHLSVSMMSCSLYSHIPLQFACKYLVGRAI